MSVSKRLRFEVLRRDNHTCRYCGASAPDVKLTVDHVIPETLGGRDEPDNLVTACDPCNANPKIGWTGGWRYFCGIIWSTIREMRDMATDVLAKESGE